MNQPMRLPGPLPVRFLLWVGLFLVFPLSVTTAAYSLQVEVLCARTYERFPPERHIAEQDLPGRILVRVEESEKRESDPWLRDDLRQSWISLSTYWRGQFPTFWEAFVDASYRMYGLHPDAVWPSIMAKRQAKLGSLYSVVHQPNDLSQVEDSSVGLPPKKPMGRAKMGATKAA
jgi:hypothetical protein